MSEPWRSDQPVADPCVDVTGKPETRTGVSPKRSYREILVSEILEGLGEIRRPTGGLLISGLSGGLDLGFSVFLMAAMSTVMEGTLPPAIVRTIMANLYAVGFIFVVLGRSELFTEHTTLAVFPILCKKAPLRSLVRLWGIVYFANLVGALLFAALMTHVGIGLGVIDAQVLGEIARGMVRHSAWITFLSALLAGWLMGLLSWLVAAGRETISQIFFVWLITGSIGLLHLHHAIVGTVEVAAGIFAGQGGLTLGQFAHFLFWTTLGNSLGGVFFVAVLKYSHAVRSFAPEPTDSVEIESLPSATRSH